MDQYIDENEAYEIWREQKWYEQREYEKAMEEEYERQMEEEYDRYLDEQAWLEQQAKHEMYMASEW